MATATRAADHSCIFERLRDLKSDQLPTYKDILTCILWKKKELKNETRIDPSLKDIVKTVNDRVISIYSRASIPAVSVMRVNELILGYHTKYRNLMKNYKSQINSSKQSGKFDAFKEHSNLLFDFAACKCKSFECCVCVKGKKVPILEREFLTDQRTQIKMFIGVCDPTNTNLLRRREARKRKSEMGMCDLEDKNAEESKRVRLVSSSTEDSVDTSTSDDEFELPPASLARISKKQRDEASSSTQESALTLCKTKSLPCFAEACDRVGVSDRGAALLSSSLLEDFGLIASEKKEYVIDRNKVRRERYNRRSTLTKRDISPIKSIYVDGKRDITFVTEKKQGKSYNRKITEEHISILCEPN